MCHAICVVDAKGDVMLERELPCEDFGSCGSLTPPKSAACEHRQAPCGKSASLHHAHAHETVRNLLLLSVERLIERQGGLTQRSLGFDLC